MVQFPETARVEWETVANAIKARHEVQKRIERGTLVEQALERLRINHEAKLIHQQEIDAERTPVLEMGTMKELLSTTAYTPPDDLIEGVVKDTGLCLVLGPSGSGKSTIAMQMIHSFMSGSDWMGQPTKPLTGGFGVMSYDMDYRMLGAMLQKYPGIDFSRVSLVQAYKQGNPLNVPDFRAKIVAAWKKMDTEVVIVDSFSASFFGGDQNDAGATMAHYRDLKQFALTEVGAKILVVIVHSTESNPHKVRGSTVHHDVADSIVGVSIDSKMQQREVRMVKYRAAPGQQQMNPVLLTAPDPVTHLIDVDFGSMAMNGMQLPASMAAQAFATPTPHEAPETGEEDDSEGGEVL